MVKIGFNWIICYKILIIVIVFSSQLTSGQNETESNQLSNSVDLPTTLPQVQTTTQTTPTTGGVVNINITEQDAIEPTTVPDAFEMSSPNISCLIDGITDDTTRRIVKVVYGDFFITVFTTEPTTTVEFLVKRINQLKLIGMNVTLGLRAIQVISFAETAEFFIQEIQFQEKCVKDSLGIFITEKIWQTMKPISKNLYKNIWILPSSEDVLFPAMSRLIYEMPWDTKKNLSVEIRAESLEMRKRFLDEARREHICFKSIPDGEKLNFVIGNDMLKAVNYGGYGTVFAVPLGMSGMKKSLIEELPNGSYIFEETLIELSDLNETISEADKRLEIISSDLINYSNVLIEMANWLNNSIYRNCPNNLNKTCNNPLNDLNNWTKADFKISLPEVLEKLQMSGVANSMNYDLLHKVTVFVNETNHVEARQIASLNLISNVSTYFHYSTEIQPLESTKVKLGHIFNCAMNESDLQIGTEVNNYTSTDDPDYDINFGMNWQIKSEAWIAAGLTISILGILMSLSILFFICTRICMEDVLEGNPVCSILLLVSLVLLFGSFIPFSLEYTGDMTIINATPAVLDTWNSLCAIRIFLLTLSYCITFSVLLCRAIMLASIGSEGGFLSHVNGYIQGVICIFSVLVQLGLSTQLIIVMHAAHSSISCDTIYYGNWLWGLIGYDGCLLAGLILLAPFYFRSQRNYHEGILILTGGLLSLAVWSTWIPLSMLGHQWRAIAVPIGAQMTGWAILGGILIPRSFLIVRGIARSDLAQALPSLTSLAFAQASQYVSEQSVYECVNPAMRERNYNDDSDPERCPSPSEIPTLPLRGSSRGNNMHHIQYHQQQYEQQHHHHQQQPQHQHQHQPRQSVAPHHPYNGHLSSTNSHYQHTQPYAASLSPSKITRF